jgi:hypothetical protein
VAPLDECAELDGRSWWEFSVDTLASPGAERLRWSADAALASRDLEVEKLTQRKDSKLLCLWDQVRRQHPGCTFELGKSGPWNDSHPYEHAIDIDIRRRRAEKILCPHCAMYCARATIQMVNNFFRGNKRFDDVANDLKALTQDHISTQLRIAGDPRDASPEGDLGHGAGGGFGGSTDNSARVTLEWAVTNSKVTGTIVRSTLTYAAVKTEIDAGSPLAVTNVQHMYLFDGYEDAHEEAVAGKKVKVPDRVHIVDPSPGEQLTKQGWTSAAKCLPEIFATWSIRSVGGGKVLTGREEDASVWADTDFDGIRDFDEGLDPVTKKLAANAPRLLQSDPTSTDTDGDGIEDKWEVVAYTYHTSQHATHNPGSDPDRDNLRAENDKDSDNDGDADGNEDTNQNGNYEPNLKETDVFDANSKAQKVKAKKGGGSPADAFAIAEGDTVFLTTDHVLLDGDTYAVSHTFPYRVYAQCPPPLVPVTPYPSGPTLVRSGLLASDAQGDLIPIDLGTFPPGCYAVALDALADGLYGYITVDPFTGDAGAGLADTVIHFQVNATTDVDRSLVLSAAASAADGAVRLVWTLPANVLGGTVRIERREVIDGVPYALAASVAAKPGDDAWLDPGLEHPGRYSYRLSIVLPDGRSASWSQGVVVDPPRLRVWTSSAPTDPVVAVHFMLPRAGAVRLEAFDAQGRRVARLCEGRGTMGANTVLVPASAVPNGAVTFVALRFGGARTGCRLVRVR